MALEEYIALALLESSWKPASASDMWEMGYDYGEDESQGRAISYYETDDGALFVRVVWEEVEELGWKKHHLTVTKFEEGDAIHQFSATLERIN